MRGANTPETVTLDVDIDGMHCPNCETLIERRFKALPGVHAARAHAANGRATVEHDGSIGLPALQAAIAEDGYTIRPAGARAPSRNRVRDYAEIAAAFAILLALLFVLKQADLLPSTIGVTDNTSLALAFAIGLVASVSTCMAVTGGLLVAAAAKYNETTSDAPGWRRLKPLLYFNAGRLVSYTVLGGAIGAIGSALTLSTGTNGAIMLVVSAVMIVFGLQMLKLLPPFARLAPRASRALSHGLHDLAGKNVKGAAFGLGAATFFLPCGFTQALQLYVLANGDALNGAATMFAFALGTLPALMSLSTVASFARGRFQGHFLKFAGAVIVVLGVLNIQYGLTLANGAMQPRQEAAAAIPQADRPYPPNIQPHVIKMAVMGLNYLPNRLTVTEGEPIEWRISGQMAAGCGRVLMAPSLGIDKLLNQEGETIIRFVAPASGEYAFNCGMGMMTQNSAIIVLPRGQKDS